MAKTINKPNEKAIKASLTARYGKNLDALDFQSAKLTTEELQMIRKTLAKRANQRLVRLERSASKVTGESYASYGAAVLAKNYIKDQTGIEYGPDDAIRFNERFGFMTDKTDIKEEILQIQAFLNSVSSTVKGQKDIEKRRIETFESGDWGTGDATKTGISAASNKEFYDFLNSADFHDLISEQFNFTSEDLVELYETAYKAGRTDEQIVEALSDALDHYRENRNSNPDYQDLMSRIIPDSASDETNPEEEATNNDNYAGLNSTGKKKRRKRRKS